MKHTEIIKSLSEKLDQLRKITQELPRAQTIICEAEGNLRSAERTMNILVTTIKYLIGNPSDITSRISNALADIEDIPLASDIGDNL